MLALLLCLAAVQADLLMTSSAAVTQAQHTRRGKTIDRPPLPRPYPHSERCIPSLTYAGSFCVGWSRPEYFILCRPTAAFDMHVWRPGVQAVVDVTRDLASKLGIPPDEVRKDGRCPDGYLCHSPIPQASKRRWHPRDGPPPRIDCIQNKDHPKQRASRESYERTRVGKRRYGRRRGAVPAEQRGARNDAEASSSTAAAPVSVTVAAPARAQPRLINFLATADAPAEQVQAIALDKVQNDDRRSWGTDLHIGSARADVAGLTLTLGRDRPAE